MNFIYSENEEKNPIINIDGLRSITCDKYHIENINFLYTNGQELIWSFNNKEIRDKVFSNLIKNLNSTYISYI